jgi:photosystem II stability/assembly factor-like uncharacterized protein
MVLVSCDMGGNYISRDGGQTWRMVNLRGQATFFSFDPGNPKVVYIGAARAIWRTEDAGDTWNLVYPDPKSVKKVVYTGDEASPLISTTAGVLGPVTAMEVDPGDSRVLYAVTDSALVKSNDWGSSWKTLGNMTGGARKILINPYSPASARSIYVVSSDRVYAYEDGQWRVNDAPRGAATWIYEAAGGYRPGKKPLIYILVDHAFSGAEPQVLGGLLVSGDGGATWTQAHQSVIESLADKWILPQIRGIAVAPMQPERAYFSYSNLRTKDDPGNVYFGVASTQDGGANWQYVWKNTSISPPSIHDVWLNQTFGPYWGENPLAMGIDPADSNRVFAGDLGRTMKTTDGGSTWDGIYSYRLPDNTFSTSGLDVTTSYGVHFDPFNPQRMFITYTDIGLFRSENGGASWVFSGSGIPSQWRNTVYWMTFDPITPGRAWAVVSGTHDLPRTRMLTKGTGAFKGGVVSSADGGKTWQVASNGLPESACTHIILDPSSPAAARTLYVAAMGKGVYKSTDGGATWTLKQVGLPGPEPLAWRLALDPSGALYLVLARRTEKTAYGTPDDGGLYRSTDGGETWSVVSLPEGLNGPTGIAIDPKDASRIFLSAWSRDDIFTNSFQGGVFLSRDAGATWKNVLTADQHVYDVTIDPSDPNRVYAAGFQASVWRSPDGGEGWTRIGGFNFKNAHRVIPDPLDPAMIYVTTFGGSVWHGPAAGDAQAKEDIVTPVVGYGGNR